MTGPSARSRTFSRRCPTRSTAVRYSARKASLASSGTSSAAIASRTASIGARSALAWLGVKDDRFLLELEEIVSASSGVPPYLLALRQLLEANPTDLPPSAAARELGLSLRTLQRRLADAETTFQSERRRAQVRAAQRLLLESDAPVTQIAHEVGSTPQRLSGLFRRIVGEPPSEWRQRHRSARPDGES